MSNFIFHGLTHVGQKELWTMYLRNIPQGVHSITVDMFGASGGVFRYFPRGRSEMDVSFRFPQTGTVTVFASLRDNQLHCQTSSAMRVEVGQPGFAAAPGSQPPLAAAGLASNAEVLGVQKPPMALDVLQQGGGHDQQPFRGGSLSGDLQAFAGEVANVTAYASDSIKQVAFSAQNASMGWMMPVDISSGSASASATMGQPGTATIFAKFIDETGAVAHEASHAIQIVARNVEGPTRPATPNPGDALRARADSLLNNLTSKLGKK